MLTEFKIKPANRDCIRLVQITDTHIFARAEDRFDGVETSASLRHVIEYIRLKPEQPGLIIVTGDLVHDAVPAAYRSLRSQLSDMDAPVFCLPGNHDDPGVMRRVLNQDRVHTGKVIEAGEWVILLLDTRLAGTHAGRLQAEELAFLEQQLEKFRDRPVLICLHHPPVSVASPWLDAMMLENPQALFTILDKFTHVRALIWGHIHQAFRTVRGKVILSACPSTCVQFKPHSGTYSRDILPPGYNDISLYRDGSIDIHTRRIS